VEAAILLLSPIAILRKVSSHLFHKKQTSIIIETSIIKQEHTVQDHLPFLFFYRTNNQMTNWRYEKMSNNKQKPQVPLILTIPREVLHALRIMAAQRNLDNPDRVASTAAIGREIILTHLAQLDEEE